MKSILEYIKLKQNTYKVIAGVAAMSVTIGWLGMRNNSYAITVNGEVVAVVKEKEEAKVAFEKVVKDIKEKKGVDIAVNDTLAIKPVNSKPKEINSQEQVTKALNSVVSYNVEAYEILVDDEVQTTVASKEIAQEILAQVAKTHLPEKAEVKLAETKAEKIESQTLGKASTIKEPVEGSQMEQVVAASTKQEELPAATPKEEQPSLATSKEEMPLATEKSEKVSKLAAPAGATQVSNEQLAELETIGENAELLQVADALPHPEIKSEIKVASVEKNEQVPQEEPEEVVEEKPGVPKPQKIQRELKVFDFNETVNIKSTYIKEGEIATPEEALEKLLSNQKEVVEYALKEGDNIWDIAMANGTTMDHILKINPQIEDETRMQIGEKITLEVPDPILSISTTEEATYKELIPAEIQYVEFTNLYKNETKVYQEGNDGLNEVTVAVHKINGIEVSRELISSKTLKKPKIKVIAYGTKERPETEENSETDENGKGASVQPSQGGKFMHPLNGGGSVSSPYGYRGGGFHGAIDIAAPAGTPIYAASAGTVIHSGYNNGGYGKLVVLDHGNGYQTYYAHCSSLYVQVGQSVSKGQNIAGVGSTGNSTGNHVHFEIRREGSPINPTGYIY